MDTTINNNVFFFISIPKNFEEMKAKIKPYNFHMQHELLSNVFPALSDKNCKPIQKITYIVDFKNCSSPKSFKIVIIFFYLLLLFIKSMNENFNWFQLKKILKEQIITNQKYFNDIVDAIIFTNFSFSFSIKLKLFMPKWIKAVKHKLILDKDGNMLRRQKGISPHNANRRSVHWAFESSR